MVHSIESWHGIFDNCARALAETLILKPLLKSCCVPYCTCWCIWHILRLRMCICWPNEKEHYLVSSCWKTETKTADFGGEFECAKHWKAVLDANPAWKAPNVFAFFQKWQNTVHNKILVCLETFPPEGHVSSLSRSVEEYRTWNNWRNNFIDS